MTSSFLLINDLRLHYLHWNTDSGGPAVVLLHDLDANARFWELAAPLLAGRGLSVLAPDLRGHGQTDQPEGAYTFEAFTRDLAAFLEAMNLERPVLAGCGWGAGLALEYAARVSYGPHAPAGLVLIEGGMVQMADEPDLTWEQVRSKLSPPHPDGLPLDEYLANLLARLGEDSPDGQPDERLIPILLSNFEVGEDETITPRLARDHQLQMARAQFEHRPFERYPRLRCPVLMAAARPPEPHFPPEAAALEARRRGLDRAGEVIRDLRVHWLDGGVHELPLQRPAELAELLADFTASVQSLGSKK